MDIKILNISDTLKKQMRKLIRNIRKKSKSIFEEKKKKK